MLEAAEHREQREPREARRTSRKSSKSSNIQEKQMKTLKILGGTVPRKLPASRGLSLAAFLARRQSPAWLSTARQD